MGGKLLRHWTHTPRNIRPAGTSFLPRHTLQTMRCTSSKDAAGEEDAKTLNLTTLRFANVVDYHETERQKMSTGVRWVSPHSADPGRAKRLPAAGVDLWGRTASTPHCAPAAPQLRPGSGDALPSTLPPLHLPPCELRNQREQECHEQRQIEDVVKAIGQQLLESFGHNEDRHENGLHLTAPRLEVRAN